MKTCETCGCKIVEENVILSKAIWTKVKAFNRFCKYAVERNKPCINNCRIKDDFLSWEYHDQLVSKEFDRVLNDLPKNESISSY